MTARTIKLESCSGTIIGPDDVADAGRPLHKQHFTMLPSGFSSRNALLRITALGQGYKGKNALSLNPSKITGPPVPMVNGPPGLFSPKSPSP